MEKQLEEVGAASQEMPTPMPTRSKDTIGEDIGDDDMLGLRAKLADKQIETTIFKQKQDKVIIYPLWHDYLIIVFFKTHKVIN